ncbi:hypothetical protein GCM10027155_16520 [Acinetobacter apis]|uniref:DUF4175 domain-containing protein n=1 Tax=Acinetobacter apis TaxID=1229165 RepID=A0A217EGK0_9GAMM|nr:hypothetical protein SAMN05444584_1567 [Acinetobacter apis]
MFTLNAPRQGLFASLLIVSFALQTVLLVVATTHQLQENRMSQGQLMTSQMIADSLQEMNPPNTVSLALIANRYATNPSVASIRILDNSNQVLATSGMEQTRTGEVFSRDALQNDQKVGRIEVTLIKPSIGEILRTEWLAIVLSFVLYLVLWLAYRVIARPSRSEYLARVNREMTLKNEIQELTLALEQEKNLTTLSQNLPEQAKPVLKAAVNDTDHEPSAQLNQKAIALNIQFYDPKQLLSSVSQSVALSYFNLCQLFLNKSIALCAKHYRLAEDDFVLKDNFSAEGITLTIQAETYKAAECLLMISSVFQLLSEVLYKRYREEKRFVLQTRSAIASAVTEMNLEAEQAASRLTPVLSAKESAVYINHKLLRGATDSYHLLALPNPNNVLTRHSFLINGMNTECAELAQQLRTDILKSKK